MADKGHSEMPTSNFKLIDEKRRAAELGERQEVVRKRTKMRDLESVLRSQENAQHLRNKESCNQFQVSEQLSLVTNVPLTLDLDASQAERSGRTILSVKVNPSAAPLDLNSEACSSTISAGNCIQHCAEDSTKTTLLKNHDGDHDNKFVASEGTGLDLNAEYVASSMNQEPVFPFKDHDCLKLRDVSECASTTGPVEEKDSLRVWKEMKQNGFLSSSGGMSIQSGFISSSHGGIPMPKHRGRKTKNDAMKKKMELAKREQVDRFTKIAAPSGLLNGLNPGIINHVRNRKQVHSIIEALVRSEKQETERAENKQVSHLKVGSKETSIISGSGTRGPILSQGDGSLTVLSGSKQTGGPISGEGEFSVADRIHGGNFGLKSCTIGKDDVLALKLSSSTKVSDESSTFSNEESANVTNGSSLCMKAASVASQWLDLLHQDIKGRLTALRRSKKRVRAVITTELPFLISKEFPSNQENIAKNSCGGLSNNATVAMHKARWSTLFDQMDKSLSEEEKQLESWLNQIKEMQQHCDHGIQHFHTIFGFQLHGTSSENNSRGGSKADCSESELAVRAAAASIYSTCNFLMSKDTVSCV